MATITVSVSVFFSTCQWCPRGAKTELSKKNSCSLVWSAEPKIECEERKKGPLECGLSFLNRLACFRCWLRESGNQQILLFGPNTFQFYVLGLNANTFQKIIPTKKIIIHRTSHTRACQLFLIALRKEPTIHELCGRNRRVFFLALPGKSARLAREEECYLGTHCLGAGSGASHKY